MTTEELKDRRTRVLEAINRELQPTRMTDEELPLPGSVETHLVQRAQDFIGGQWLLVDINMNQDVYKRQPPATSRDAFRCWKITLPSWYSTRRCGWRITIA